MEFLVRFPPLPVQVLPPLEWVGDCKAYFRTLRLFIALLIQLDILGHHLDFLEQCTCCTFVANAERHRLYRRLHYSIGTCWQLHSRTEDSQSKPKR